MKSIEEAYNCIARAILWFVQGEKWRYGKAETSIWEKSTQTSYSRAIDDVIVKDDKFPPLALSLESSAALIFLRDDVLKSTGQRVWGVAFTLYPDGKFNIEYDYNKPEGYEETDETISGDEINLSLNQIISDGKNAKG